MPTDTPNNTSASATPLKPGTAVAVTVTATQPPPLPKAPAVTPPSVDKGPGLERWVPINVLLSFMGTALFVGLGTTALFDRNVSTVTVSGWVYLLAGLLAVDGLLFFCTVLMTSRKWRKEIKRNGRWYVYPDAWYHTHMSVALTTVVMSAWTFSGVFLYYHNFGGEDPYQWPSAYQIQQWDKPLVWFVILGVSCMGRIMLLTDKYLAVYRALAEPGLIEKPVEDEREGR